MENQNNNLQVRDFRNGDWFWVNKSILEDECLTSTAKLIYSSLALFANNRSQDCYPSLETLAKIAGTSERSAMRSVKQLEKAGYIRVKRIKGKTSVYFLLKVMGKTCGKSGGDKKSLVTKKAKPVTLETPVVVTPETPEQSNGNNLNNNNGLLLNNRKRYETMTAGFRDKLAMTDHRGYTEVQEEEAAELRHSGQKSWQERNEEARAFKAEQEKYRNANI